MRAEAALMTLALACRPAPPPLATAIPASQASSPMGWRCPPGARACLDRADLAAPFACTGERCVQAHPVMPDDGEWTCGETAGVTLCTVGETAAGVAPTGLAPGWVCGNRRGQPPRGEPTGSAGRVPSREGLETLSGFPSNDRVCRDAAPDFPDGAPTGWRCHYEGPALPRRVCVRDPANHVVGDPCDARRPCVDGAICRAGICGLPAGVPSCWLDADCASGTCRFGNCPGDATSPSPPSPLPPTVPPLRAAATLDFGPPRPQVGFDAEFTIRVQVRSGVRPPTIAWRQIGGGALPGLRVSDDGYAVSGRTVSWQTALGTEEPPWGVVPFSPRTRGEAVLEASWQEAPGTMRRHEMRIAAASLSRGLTTVPTGGRLHLGGEGWHVQRAAEGSRATLEAADGLTSFTPDLPGVWRLRDGAGRALDLIAGRYDDVPLDCSRAKCHPEMLAGSLVSPMTTVLARLLDSFPKSGPHLDRQTDYPGCALPCHATGEPGVLDGGYYDLARAMNRTGDERTRWPELPRMLRRLGGAGCLACHGPGAVPDPRASWTTLRSDVCAICHDAPPVYRHVAAWRSSANFRADRDPDAASRPACVRCHTTWGFLRAEKPTREAASADHLTFMASLRPPAHAGPIGIACAACHDSHPTVDPAGKTPHALLRKVAHPTILPALPTESARRSEICLPCHTPDMASNRAPLASAAALWLGRGGLDPTTGALLDGPAPLADLDGGCLHCHRGDTEGSRGGNHSFAVRLDACPDCPPLDPRRPDGVQRRARQLYLDARLFRLLGEVRPLHVSQATIPRDRPAGRALWNLLLLLEDQAAEVHNPPYAQALLESAESVLRSPAAVRELVRRRR